MILHSCWSIEFLVLILLILFYLFMLKSSFGKKRGQKRKKGSQCCHSRRPSLPRGPVLLRAVGSRGPTLAQPHASLPFPSPWPLTARAHSSTAPLSPSSSPVSNRTRLGRTRTRSRDTRDSLTNRVHRAPIKVARLAPHPVFPPCREIKP